MKIGIYQGYWGRLGGGQRYVGVVAEILSRGHDVEIVHHCDGFDRAAIEEGLEVDLSRVRFRFLPRRERPSWSTKHPLRRLEMERQWGREISEPYDLFVDSSDVPPFFCHAKRGLLLVHFPLVGFEEFHGRNTDAWRSCSSPRRMLTAMFHRLEWRRRFQTYDRCIVNSEFTRRWLRRLWGMEADVVFPPLREPAAPAAKRRQVLSIGAFSATGHKRHAVMIDAFRRLCEGGVVGWNYVLVGACGPAAEDLQYVSDLKRRASGLPIEICTNLSGEAVRRQLAESSVLWHAMGYGVDPDKEPQRMEHFGMVACEAQAAGAVPIVFNGGGLPEIISSGTDGLLWNTMDELVDGTRRLIVAPQRLSELSCAARRNAGRFARARFEDRLLQAIAPLMPPREASLV
jgi:glycosyltransferase involved in cell wall biosynthesis